MKYFASILTFWLAASVAIADEFVIGIGGDDVLDQTGTQAPAVVLEYHLDPFYTGQIASYSFGGAGQIDGDGDIFLGLGVHANWSIAGGPWFIEGSFMPGYYDEGSGGTDLGGNIQFRTLLGVGYNLASGRKISLAIDHKSNADLEDRNPGSETLVLRYTLDF